MLATISSSAVDHLTGAVDALAEESIEGHTTHAIGDDLAAMRREIDRLEAQFLRRLRRFDTHHGALAEGAASTVSWLRGTCGLTGAAAVQRVRMSRLLDELPRTTASFRAGRTSFTNASLIARLAGDVGTEATAAVEETLVTAAEKVDPGRMWQLAVYTRHCIDADGVLAQDERNHERRWFSCDQTFDGVVILRGQLDAEGGALVKAAIDASSTRSGPHDPRTGSQRRADA
nr:13E12 repeat family protein [Candidatus Dormibacteraeota bacterium]